MTKSNVRRSNTMVLKTAKGFTSCTCFLYISDKKGIFHFHVSDKIHIKSSSFPGGPIQPTSLWTRSPWPSSSATSSSFPGPYSKVGGLEEFLTRQGGVWGLRRWGKTWEGREERRQPLRVKSFWPFPPPFVIDNNEFCERKRKLSSQLSSFVKYDFSFSS